MIFGQITANTFRSEAFMNSPRFVRPAFLALAVFAAALLWAGAASAHLLGLPTATHGEFLAGFGHPFSGLDHILAMGAVGILAAHQGGRGLWLLPATFIFAMIAGFAVAKLGIGLPWVELGIAGSIVALGLAIVVSDRMPLSACATLIALCAVMHGHAHGTEALALADPLHYVGGFALATAMLHGSGIVLGLGLRRMSLLPEAGTAIAVMGLVFVLGT
jgi:urease accessory protein